MFAPGSIGPQMSRLSTDSPPETTSKGKSRLTIKAACKSRGTDLCFSPKAFRSTRERAPLSRAKLGRPRPRPRLPCCKPHKVVSHWSLKPILGLKRIGPRSSCLRRRRASLPRWVHPGVVGTVPTRGVVTRGRIPCGGRPTTEPTLLPGWSVGRADVGGGLVEGAAESVVREDVVGLGNGLKAGGSGFDRFGGGSRRCVGVVLARELGAAPHKLSALRRATGTRRTS